MARKRDSGGGPAFVGFFVAALFAGLGVICLVMEEIPIGTRGDPIWVGGPRKDCFAYCFLSLAAALHLGFFWSRVPSLRVAAPVLALAALAAAGFFFFATLA